VIEQAETLTQLSSYWATSSNETGSAVLDSLLPYLNLGIVVVLVLMFVTKTGIVPKWTLDESERRHKQERDDDQHDHLRELQSKDGAHQRELAAKDSAIQLLERDKEELKRTNEQLTRVAQEQFLPALIEANRLTALYVDTIARRQSPQPPSGGGQS
jgi:hypothetical protein